MNIDTDSPKNHGTEAAGSPNLWGNLGKLILSNYNWADFLGKTWEEEPLFHIFYGKRLHNYGKSPCLMGKLTVSMAMFNSFLYVYQRVGVLERSFTMFVPFIEA